MTPHTAEEFIEDLALVLRNFQGREYWDEIGRQTRFFGDLGFASIDAVVLGETLERRYGKKIPYNQLLADLGRRQAEDLEVGELADFLERHLGG